MKRAISGQNLFTLGDSVGSEGRAIMRAAYRREQERDTVRKRRHNAKKHRRRRR